MTDELVYVSWGGSGRGAALRAAYEQAAEADLGLIYLAILDPPHFADLDDTLMRLVVEELEWLLDAHMRTVAAASGREVSTRVLVRVGEVDDTVADLVQTTNASAIAIGAPISVEGKSIDELVEALARRTGVSVSVIDPTESPASQPASFQ